MQINTPVKFYSLLFIPVFLLPLACSAQFTISGRILNQADTRPLPYASVFLSNATIGAKTPDNGTFTLNDVKPGKYELVVSCVGFEKFSQPVMITNANINLRDLLLFPKTILLKEVKIKPKDDAGRERNLKLFTDYFLGTSALAQECSIVNPGIVDLDYDEETNTLSASTSNFLEIENNALGYRIQYLLGNFKLDTKNSEIHYEGQALFTEMRGTPAQERRWQKNRAGVYENSSIHFLRAALNDQLGNEGFRTQKLALIPNPERPADDVIKAGMLLFKDSSQPHARDSLAYWKKKAKLPPAFQKLIPAPLTKSDFIQPTGQKGIYALACNGCALLIDYNKNHRFHANGLNNLGDPHNTETTMVALNTAVLFDSNGGIIDPNSVTYSGAWGNNRIAELLPVDYVGQSNPVTAMDSTVIKNVSDRLSTFATANIVEKTYLHLNKPSYFLGDTVWYKAYTVMGDDHHLSTLSGVLHVELISPADSVIKRENLELTSGVTWGDIALSRKLKPGNYRLRAYTNWMLNAGPEYFYEQKFRLGGLPAVLDGEKNVIAAGPDVQFFPEGGELVNGLRSRVAVKAVNAKGLGEDIKGTIEDNEGNVVADFATQHLGMGVFAITPQSGKTYKAKISGAGETAFTVSLPTARETGYTLSLNNSRPDSIYLKVAANAPQFKEKQNAAFYLVAQAGGKIYYTAAGKLQNPVFTSTINKGRFPSGIVQFTLFSESGEPLNERIAFIQNDDTLKLKITAPAKAYNTRQNVKLALDAKGGDGKAAAGSFSVSVINESRLGADETAENNIYNNLLLTSDLKGYIEKANYYFLNPGAQTRADLDVLMLTQGYRRFEWKKVLGNALSIAKRQPEKLLELAGNIQTPSGKPVVNGKVTLTATRENFFADTVTDINGNFRFTGLDLPDTAKIVLSARKQNDGKNVTIFLKKPDYPPVSKQKETEAAMTPGLLAMVQKNYAAHQQQQKNDSLKNGQELKEVVIKGKKTVKPDKSNAYGADIQFTIPGSKLAETGNLMQGLQRRLLGVSYRDGKFFSSLPPHRQVPVVINERQTDPSEINLYSPEEIDNVRLLEGGQYAALYGVEGDQIIFITTKQYAGTDTASTVKMLKEVNINAGKINKGPDLSYSANLNGGGHADQVIDGNKLDGCISLLYCLIGKISGVIFRDGMAYSTRTGAKLGGTSPAMALIIDGDVLDGVSLNDINASDINSIEVLRSGAYLAIYGSNAPGGALVITTRHGSANNYVTTESPSGLLPYRFQGFYKAKAFYSPKYNGPKTDAQPRDLRSAIYWNPNIITGADGKASFEYFNNDTKGTYKVVVEGIDDNGSLGRVVFRYKVE
jgi:hypothetical protein